MRPAVLVSLIFLTTCATKKTLVTIPANCMHIHVTDFTKPCRELADGNMMCDGVQVHVDCVSAK